MKKLQSLFAASTFLSLPVVASAQLTSGSGAGNFGNIFLGLTNFIDQILIPFLLALAFLFFIWGMFLYFIAGGGDEEKRAKGKGVLVWSVVAFLFITAVFAVVNLLSGSIGLDSEDQTLQVPVTPGQ
jgi:hypothetical protein